MGKPAWLDKAPLETSQQWVSGERSQAQKSLWCPGLGASCALGLVPVKANAAVSSPVVLPSPPVAAAGAMGTGRTRCRVHSPSQAHRCRPTLLSARAPRGREAVLSRGGLFPAPETGHQLSIGGRLGLQLLLSGQVEQDFQYMGGDIK